MHLTETGPLEMFPMLEDVVENAGLQLEIVQPVIIAHLDGLDEQFA